MQKTVSFPTEDGGVVFADLYGTGERGVVLAHGGRFNKESWAKQARVLADSGFRVLAFDFRGYGESHGPGQADIFTAPLHLDVLAAVRYLRRADAKTVSVIGGGLGGRAAGDASIASEPGEIQRLVFLGSSPNGPAEKLKCPSLFILARDDASEDGPRLPGIRAKYEKAPEPKERRRTKLDLDSGEPLDDLHWSSTLGAGIKTRSVFGGGSVVFRLWLWCCATVAAPRQLLGATDGTTSRARVTGSSLESRGSG